MRILASAICGIAILCAPLCTASQAAEIRGIANKCLNVSGGGSADGTPIILYHCSGTPNEQWTISHGEIRGIGNKCLDVSGGGSADGTPIVLYTCKSPPNNANQLWIVR